MDSVRNELEVSGEEILFMVKRKEHSQFDFIRTTKFIQYVMNIINQDSRNLIRVIKIWTWLVVHEDIKYKSYMISRGQFMFSRNWENHVIQSKHLPNKLQHSEEAVILLQNQVNRRMAPWINNWAWESHIYSVEFFCLGVAGQEFSQSYHTQHVT